MNIGALTGFGREATDRRFDLRALRFELDDGTGAALATGAKAVYQTMPVDATLVGYRLMAGSSGF